MKAEKQAAEIYRVAEQRKQRTKLILEEEKRMKSIQHSNSSHMKLALQRCGTFKRRYVNVVRPQMEPWEELLPLYVPSMDALKKRTNVLDAFMIQRCEDLEPWKEVLPL